MTGSESRGGRRLGRRPVVLAALFAAVGLTGCATKRDVRDLSAEIANLRARQDTVLVILSGQNRAVRDSLFQVLNELIRTRGDLRNDLQRLEQQLTQIQQLAGQTQRSLLQLQDLERRLREAPRAARPDDEEEAAPPGSETTRPVVERSTGTPADELYGLGLEQLDRGAAATARLAFEQLLQEHPGHARAPDAQFMIGETYYAEKRYDEALKALERVVELYPNASKSPQALYRAGVIAEERGNFSAARGYFNRVIGGWPRTEEARLADQALKRLPSR